MLQLVRHYSAESRQRDSDVVITSRVHRSCTRSETARWINVSRLIRRQVFNPRYNKIGLHLEGSTKDGKSTVMVLSAFSLPEKGARRVAETVSCSLQPDSVSLRLENRQWTFNLAHHSPLWNFQDSLTPSNNHLRVPSPSFTLPLSPFHLVLHHLRIPPHGTLQNNGVAGGRTNRPAERTTLHFYISMQNDEKKKKTEESLACVFFIFLYGSRHFYWKVLASREFRRISRIYQEIYLSW